MATTRKSTTYPIDAIQAEHAALRAAGATTADIYDHWARKARAEGRFCSANLMATHAEYARDGHECMPCGIGNGFPYDGGALYNRECEYL